jgi:hypothetical protein
MRTIRFKRLEIVAWAFLLLVSAASAQPISEAECAKLPAGRHEFPDGSVLIKLGSGEAYFLRLAQPEDQQLRPQTTPLTEEELAEAATKEVGPHVLSSGREIIVRDVGDIVAVPTPEEAAAFLAAQDMTQKPGYQETLAMIDRLGRMTVEELVDSLAYADGMMTLSAMSRPMPTHPITVPLDSGHGTALLNKLLSDRRLSRLLEMLRAQSPEYAVAALRRGIEKHLAAYQPRFAQLMEQLESPDAAPADRNSAEYFAYFASCVRAQAGGTRVSCSEQHYAVLALVFVAAQLRLTALHEQVVRVARAAEANMEQILGLGASAEVTNQLAARSLYNRQVLCTALLATAREHGAPEADALGSMAVGDALQRYDYNPFTEHGVEDKDKFSESVFYIRLVSDGQFQEALRQEAS